MSQEQDQGNCNQELRLEDEESQGNAGQEFTICTECKEGRCEARQDESRELSAHQEMKEWRKGD